MRSNKLMVDRQTRTLWNQLTGRPVLGPLAAFEAGHWLVNEVKRRVPVWKKEVWADGEEWIEGPESLGLERAPASMRAR